MKKQPVRMPRRILWGMPVILAMLYWGHTGGGAAALFLWLTANAALPEAPYPYPRKSRRSWPRLFFAFSGGFFVLFRLIKLAAHLGIPFPPAYPGISALSVTAAGGLWQWPLKKKWKILGGVLLCISAGM